MQAEERFLREFARGIVTGIGRLRFTEESALEVAREVWANLKEIGPNAFPAMVQRDDLRFVYQWDQQPQVLTIMVWDDVMWRDMANIEVPLEVGE